MEAAQRAAAREAWLVTTLAGMKRRQIAAPVALTAEASTRRFTRIHTDAGALVLMDAPPQTENNAAFLALAPWLRKHGLHAPEVHAADPQQGFMLLEDLGDHLLGTALANTDAAGRRDLYRLAITTLIRFQCAGRDDPPSVPAYDRARLERELGLFRDWFAQGLLQRLPPDATWSDTAAALTATALAQPRACVYLDYHSRNLLLLEHGGEQVLGLVDFQDVHAGPVCYDLVSLLRDCYLRWPEAEVRALRGDYLEAARAAGLPGLEDEAAFVRGFDLCGAQRHLKALGIFARVALTRGQTHYLDDMPRVLTHLAEVLPRYPETEALGRWLASEIAPDLPAVLARHRAVS